MKKILVIDDLAEFATAVAAILRAGGFHPVIAYDGLSGLELAQQESPDLVICDVKMPRCDGYETLKGLRANALTATTPFIFMSGLTERPEVRRGMELGADDYLAKPFTPNELIATVRTRLARKEKFEHESGMRLDEVRGNITLALPHELLTPLGAILGLSQALVEDHQTVRPVEVLEIGQCLHRSAQRLERLIENFLIYADLELHGDSARSSRGKAAGTSTPTAGLVTEAATRAAREAQREKDLKCDTVLCAAGVLADELTKIVEELTGNAFKFSEPGSQVQVRTEADNGRFTLSVTDFGRGMTADQIARIGPHLQFDRRIHEQQGMGLGLVIARRLTELQGGRWSLQSTPGRQTTVQVSFPLAGAGTLASLCPPPPRDSD
jgi:two-component system, sensor histidine kinase and response regulator